MYKLYASLFAIGAARGCVALPFYLRYIYMYIWASPNCRYCI